MRKRVYISGPLSLGGTADESARIANVAIAAGIAAQLIEKNYAPLCPQLTEYIEILTGRHFEHDVWIDADLPWVECADAVLRLPGESAGSDMEVRHAQEIGVPVFYSIEQLDCWRRAELEIDNGTGFTLG